MSLAVDRTTRNTVPLLWVIAIAGSLSLCFIFIMCCCCISCWKCCKKGNTSQPEYGGEPVTQIIQDDLDFSFSQIAEPNVLPHNETSRPGAG